ncbi:hypothetical protein [Bythopirellula polymerisocia]|uniref:Uncharacterized protein n=1 Tax=Bythopirellula polymerisocia TaxID=2528003 RepID=A0A5C6CYI9_9BACT|nr:hypothetical protein [Bythopirellula polymerisocia]TWU28654.1 hypothetical protein Pla144_19460 [Bythopirellula polymerisocia]
MVAVDLSVGATRAEPQFSNSVVSNDLDFIHDGDCNARESFYYIPLGRREMPGSGALFAAPDNFNDPHMAPQLAYGLWIGEFGNYSFLIRNHYDHWAAQQEH